MIKARDRCKYNNCNKKSTTTIMVKGSYPPRIIKVCQEHRNKAYGNKGA